MTSTSITRRFAAAPAQGLILETLEDLAGSAEPPVLRGTLPRKVDLSGTIPAPRNQADTSTCTSWGATYAAASQAASTSLSITVLAGLRKRSIL